LYWDSRPLRQYDRVSATRWTRAIGVIVLIGLVGLVARQLFVTAWSNHCDPGNVQFELIKNDPVVAFHAPGELFTWENDQPDNSFTCSNPALSLNHVGSDVKAMYAATQGDMTANGWTELNLGQSTRDFSLYQKEAAGGVRLTAVVLQQTAWVEVDLDAPGLHPGDQGF